MVLWEEHSGAVAAGGAVSAEEIWGWWGRFRSRAVFTSVRKYGPGDSLDGSGRQNEYLNKVFEGIIKE